MFVERIKTAISCFDDCVHYTLHYTPTSLSHHLMMLDFRLFNVKKYKWVFTIPGNSYLSCEEIDQFSVLKSALNSE